MGRTRIVYREVNGQVERSLGHAQTRHYSDAERLMHEGTQGEKVLRGYRDLESQGKYSRKPGTDSADTIRRVWAPEVSGRFK